MTVAIDLDAGRVTIAGTVLDGVSDASSVELGALALGDGSVMVPISYGQRAELCALHRDRDALAAATLAAARRGGRSDDATTARSETLETLALHLAGARAASDRPGFGDVAVIMRRVFGWDAGGLLAAPAHLVDELAATAADEPAGRTHPDHVDHPDHPDHGDAHGWVSFELRDDVGADHPGPGAPLDALHRGRDGGDVRGAALGELRAALVDDLLRRGAMALASASAAPDAGDGDDGAAGRAGGGDPFVGAVPVGATMSAGSDDTRRAQGQWGPGGSGPDMATPSSGSATVAGTDGLVQPTAPPPGSPAAAASDDAPLGADSDTSDNHTSDNHTSHGAERTGRSVARSSGRAARTAVPSAASDGTGPRAGTAVPHEPTARAGGPAVSQMPPDHVLGDPSGPVRAARDAGTVGRRPAEPIGAPARRGGRLGLADALDRRHAPNDARTLLAGADTLRHSEIDELADELAAALDRESDIRGLLPW